MRKTKRNFKETPSNARANGWRQRWRAVGATSVAVLVVLGVIVMNPVAESAWAEWGDAATGSLDLPSGAQIDLNSTKDVQSEVTLTMDASSENGRLNASAADTNPDSAADVVRRTASVELTNTSGYTVKIRGSSANLTGATTSNVIPSVTTTTTLGQMENAWGWSGSVGDTVADCSPASTFKQMTTDDQELGSGGAESSATKKVTMCFGARIDGTKAADTYSNTVTLSVVAQPGKVATFDGITQMQQMTPAICKAAEVNDTAQLEDVRDGKKYWVTKLLDGNCWMSQNLALDLSASKPLTSADSDVESSWTPGHDTVQESGIDATTLAYGRYEPTGTYSWSLGDYVARNPTDTKTRCDNTEGLSSCTEQFAAVDELVASSDPNFYRSSGGKTFTDLAYDAHYLVGNYYQWNAATAGTGGALIDANATGSICPKGWKLPNSGIETEQLENGSFNYMLWQYGLANELGGRFDSLIGTSDSNGLTYNVTLAPLFFTAGGFISGKISNAGMTSHYRSSRATATGQDKTANYVFTLSVSYISTTNTAAAETGYSVRCLFPTT